MFQTFFLVMLPGLAPWGALGAACFFVSRWLHPKVQREKAERQRMSRETHEALRYRGAARPIIDNLAIQIECDPALKQAIPDEIQDRIYRLVTDNDTED